MMEQENTNIDVDLQTACSHESRPKILVVDDEPDVLEVITDLLEMKGHEVMAYSDPTEAFAAFMDETVKPNLLISDYQMPKMNGLELLQLCKAEHPALRCISASGTLQIDDMQKYVNRPDRFLPKPFRSKQLWDAVDEMLQD